MGGLPETKRSGRRNRQVCAEECGRHDMGLVRVWFNTGSRSMHKDGSDAIARGLQRLDEGLPENLRELEGGWHWLLRLSDDKVSIVIIHESGVWKGFEWSADDQDCVQGI